INIDELASVMERARSLGAFRFNTGKLMRIGTAARLWNNVEPTKVQYGRFQETLERAAAVEAQMELCYIPFDMAEALRRTINEPPATLLVLPNGWVKVAAALPYVCADLHNTTLAEAWSAYCNAWRDAAVIAAAKRATMDESLHAQANSWTVLPIAILEEDR